MKKIVITLDQLRRATPGGIGTYVRGLLSGLEEIQPHDGRAFDVVGLAPLGPQPDPLAQLGVDVRSSKLGTRVTTKVWSKIALGVPKDADIVHACAMSGPFAGGTKSAVHSVLVHDVLWRDHHGLTTVRGARFHEARLKLIERRDSLRVLVTSSDLADVLIATGIATERIHVIRLGVDRPTETNPPTLNSLIDRFQLADVVGPSGNFSVAVGTVQPRKNYERLVAAHTRARAREPELGPLIIVGGRGWGDVNLNGAISVGSVSSEAGHALVAHARVVAYVPLEEGWGLPAVEALVAGRPLVVSRGVPSVRGLDVTFDVDPLNEEEITEALVSAVHCRDDEGARNARRAAVAHLTWATCAKDHLAAWS